MWKIKSLVVAVLLASTISVSSCKTGASPDGGGGTPIVSTVIDCAEKATHIAALNILDDASAALATGNWEAALADLALRWGQAAVSCAVQQITSDSAHAFQASSDQLEGLKASRGRAYLAAHPVGN